MYSMDDAGASGSSPHPSSDIVILSKNQFSSLQAGNSSSTPTTSPSLVSSLIPNSTNIELPPAHVQQHLAEIYLQDVHPVFPLLSRSSIISRSYKPRSLVLALCAYCACLSPTLGAPSPAPDESSASAAAGIGDATRIAAEMW